MKLGRLQKTESSDGTCKENKGIFYVVGSDGKKKQTGNMNPA